MTTTTTIRRRVITALLIAPMMFSSCGHSEREPSHVEKGSTATVAHRHDSPGETCFICDASKREAGRLWCDEHSRYEDRCWDCHPELEEKGRLTPLASAIVQRVLVDVGADVKAGDVLVELHSADVASAKSAFVSAVVDLNLKEVACKRERRLAEKKISSEKEVQEADAACRTAELTLSTTRQRLLNLGFTNEEVEAISKEQDSSATLLVRAPYDGTIVEREAVVGEAVSPGDDLFTLANLNTMWLSLSIPADKARFIKRGLTVEATFAGHTGDEFTGTLTWVNTSIDERTRMLRARAVVDNVSRALMAGMFGEARVLLGQAGAAVSVPPGAVQRYEQQPYVFVKVEDDLYSLRRVALVEGRPSDDHVAVLAGLTPNEPVVTEGAFTVMSEFLKSRLGAGCVDD